MNENEPPPIPPALSQITPNSGMGRKWEIVLSCAFGVALILLLCFVFVSCELLLEGEPGLVALFACASFIGVWVCFFITQFFLSYGNPQALRKNWPFILAMNLAPFCLVFIALAVLPKWAGLVMLVVTITTLACSCAGAGLAALIARRRLRVVPPYWDEPRTVTNNPSPI